MLHIKLQKSDHHSEEMFAISYEFENESPYFEFTASDELNSHKTRSYVFSREECREISKIIARDYLASVSAANEAANSLRAFRASLQTELKEICPSIEIQVE